MTRRPAPPSELSCLLSWGLRTGRLRNCRPLDRRGYYRAQGSDPRMGVLEKGQQLTGTRGLKPSLPRSCLSLGAGTVAPWGPASPRELWCRGAQRSLPRAVRPEVAEALRHSGTHGLMLGTSVPTLGVGLSEEPTFSLGKEGAECRGTLTAHLFGLTSTCSGTAFRQEGLWAVATSSAQLGSHRPDWGWSPGPQAGLRQVRSWPMGPGPQRQGSFAACWQEQTSGPLRHRPFQPEPAAPAPGSPSSSHASHRGL